MSKKVFEGVHRGVVYSVSIFEHEPGKWASSARFEIHRGAAIETIEKLPDKTDFASKEEATVQTAAWARTIIDDGLR